MNKTNKIHVRCTPDFQEDIKRCSKQSEMTQSTFVREAVYHYIRFLENKGLIKPHKN